MQTNRKDKMSRIRLNQEYRNKIANRMNRKSYASTLGTRGHARKTKV